MAVITEEQLSELTTLYWWLQGFLSVPVGESTSEIMKEIETNLPMDYVDTLAHVVNAHDEGGRIEIEEPEGSKIGEQPDGAFDFDEHGNCEECGVE